MIFVLYHFLIFCHKYALSFWWILRLNMDTESQNEVSIYMYVPSQKLRLQILLNALTQPGFLSSFTCIYCQSRSC